MHTKSCYDSSGGSRARKGRPADLSGAGAFAAGDERGFFVPSNYAHYRFGQEVRSLLTGRERQAVDRWPELFFIGVHGPDIFFHYHPLRANAVRELGHGMHRRPGREFFVHAADTLRQIGLEEAHLAYVCGFLCHFALDVTCHGYVDLAISRTGVSHVEIEGELDRALLVDDGEDPIRRRLTSHIVPSRENAAVIADFFPSLTPEQVAASLRGMIANDGWMTAPGRFKRGLVSSALKVSGHYEELHGLMINYEPNPRCAESTRRLRELYSQAVPRGAALIGSYVRYLAGEEELGKLYDYTFGSRPGEKEDAQ